MNRKIITAFIHIGYFSILIFILLLIIFFILNIQTSSNESNLYYDGIPIEDFDNEMMKGVQGDMSLEYVDSIMNNK